jgi:protein-disulfide isomerase
MKKNNSKKFAILGIVAVLVIGFVALIVHNYKTKTSFKYASQKAEELKPDQNPQDKVNAAVNEEAAKKALDETRKNSDILKINSSDIILGDKNAPVTIIEYASLSCPHCAAFTRESFEKLKEEFIDNGKAKFIFRHFPLNQPALSAAMFVNCQAHDHKEEPEKYYFALKALMKTQDSWAFDQKFNEKLEAIAKLDGMSSERFNACINDKKLQEKILSERMEAAKTLELKSTPSFFVNGEISEGYIDYVTIKKLVEKKLSEKK